MKKLLFISYYWPPGGGAGVQRPLKFVKYLSERYQVFVITVRAEKASYPVTDETLSADVPANVTVIRTDSFEPLNILSFFTGKKKIPHGGFTDQKETMVQRMLRFIRGNFFIPDARTGWVKFAFRQAEKLITEERIDTVVISSPPHSSQLIGLKLKRKFPSVKWIADMRDPWTDIYYYPELLHTPMAKRRDARLEREVLEGADATLVVSPSMRKLFTTKSKNLSDKMHVIPNGFDEDDFRQQPVRSDKFTIAYTGTIADSYRPEIFFSALRHVREMMVDLPVALKFTGSVSEAVRNVVRDNFLADVTEYISYIPHDEAVLQMKSADVLLLLIPDTKEADGILTGKLFEYLGAGRKVVGIGPPGGDAAAILSECNAGKMFSRDQEEELKSYLLELARDWKLGKPPVQSEHVMRYSRRAQAMQLSDIIEKLN